MSFQTVFVLMAFCLAVTACGDTTGEQAALGGGVGAIGGAVVGANPIATAAVGAGANVLYCEVNPSKCN